MHYNECIEAQGLLEVESSAILGLVGSNPFLFFLFAASSRNLDNSNWFPFKGGAGYDSGATALVTKSLAVIAISVTGAIVGIS